MSLEIELEIKSIFTQAGVTDADADAGAKFLAVGADNLGMSREQILDVATGRSDDALHTIANMVRYAAGEQKLG